MEVKAHYREGRKSPWEARWWMDGKMKTRFFATKSERDRFIRELSKELQQHGTDVFSFDKSKIRRWIEADKLLPDVDPVELVQYWLKSHANEKQKVTMNVAIDKYLEYLSLAGRTQSYIAHAEKSLARFNAEHGDQMVDSIISDHIQNYISQLPFQPVSKRHERSYLTSAFKWFVLQGWVTRNPVDLVPVPKIKTEEPGILTIAQAQALFRTNEHKDPEVCGLLALGAFAGLRSSAIERLKHKNIDFKNRGILIESSIAKARRRHYIESLPDNLWAWLDQTPKSAFSLTSRQIAKRRERAYERAGLLITKAASNKKKIPTKSPPKNCLRHSFVSYHVALHRNPGKTALIVSHRSQEVLWQHYLGVAGQKDAKEYFAILPKNFSV